MLSRLSATRSVIRPALSTISVRKESTKSKNLFLKDGAFGVTAFHQHEGVLPKAGSTETPVIPEFPYGVKPWRDDAWPFFTEYKNIAGQSAGPVLAFGLGTYIFSNNFIGGGILAILGIQAFNYYHIYRLAQSPAKNFFKKEQKEWMDQLYAEKAAKLVDSEAKIAEAAVVANFLEDRPEFFDIMENQVELQAEVTYRKRLLEVETEIKKRLDYQVEMQNVERAIEEKHIAAWVEKEVLKSISEQRDEDTFQACINNLEDMAAAKATA